MIKTRADYMKELRVLAEDFAIKQGELIKLHNAAPEKAEEKPWPQKGDVVWGLTGYGEIRRDVWRGSESDLARKAFHNFFRTEAEAIQARNYQQFEGDVRAKAKELNGGWVADWSDSTKSKYVIEHYSRDRYAIEHKTISNREIVRGSSCKSEQAAQALLDHFGADKFLAYATGGDL